MIESLAVALRRYGVVCAVLFMAFAVAPSAHAEAVLIGYGSMFGGTLTTDVTLNMVGSDQLPAGKLTVQVADLGVPLTIIDRLKSLSFSITNSTGVFASHLGEGILAVDLPGPDFYTLHIVATPADQFKIGALSWNTYFEPLAPVPLPAGVWLLIAGAAWAIGLQRKGAKLFAHLSTGRQLWRTQPALAH